MVFAALLAIAALGTPGAALAYGDGTPDGQPPAEELVCDTAGLERAAFGLCIAFCEAGDCDVHPSRPSCRGLRRNYTRLTGQDRFPCELQTLPPWFLPG